MRRRTPYLVCRCLPNGVVTHLETRMLRDFVNRGIHAIRCAGGCKQIYQKAMYLGNLCVETRHYWWAMKIWRFASRLIEEKDYDDWCDVWFNTRRVRLRDVISETECELLNRRCSLLWRVLGHPEYDWWDERVEHLTSTYYGTTYHCLFADKYDGYSEEQISEWEEEMLAAAALQQTMQIFREGQKCE